MLRADLTHFQVTGNGDNKAWSRWSENVTTENYKPSEFYTKWFKYRENGSSPRIIQTTKIPLNDFSNLYPPNLA